MINFVEELKKFQFMELDEDIVQLKDESSVMMKLLQNTLKRTNLEQNKTNTQLEEIAGLVEENLDQNAVIAGQRNELLSVQEQNTTLVNGFISVLDQIEDLYRFSVKTGYSSWSGQLRLMWDGISNILLSMGITRIEGDQMPYSQVLHSVSEIRHQPGSGDGIVVEVLRSGYIYNSKVLRRANVAVNRSNSVEEVQNENNNRD